jgi:uncharacterized membrane protein YphA (DoxX/SURF4 family)
MSLSAKLRRAPLRIATGAYIVNSGVSKIGADDDTAKSLHGMASGTYPVLDKAEPRVFAKALGAGEVAVGAALLLPIVPPFVAGAALVGFSAALLNMYWNTPGLHEEGSPRPTPQGQPLAKDIWLMGIGVGLMADAALEPAHDRVVGIEASMSQKRADRSARARRKAKKLTKRARNSNADYLKQARESAMELQAEAAKRAKKARKQADKASGVAAARLADLRDEYGPVALDKVRAARDAARDLAGEYGPIAAEKARAARDAARDLAGDYGPVAAEKAKVARHAAQEYGAKAQEYAAMAKEYGAKAQKYGAKARERVAR